MIALGTGVNQVHAQDTTDPSYSLEDVLQARQATAQDRQETLAQNQAAREEQMAARNEAVCSELQARINNRLNRYETNKDKYHSRYRGIHTKATDLADKLEDQGCDVALIRTDLATFDEYLDNFAAAFRVFVDSMKTTRTHACGESDGEFRGQISTARDYLLAMRERAQELHQFIKGTFKTHIRQTAQTCQAVAVDETE